jgi:hypothetical protein
MCRTRSRFRAPWSDRTEARPQAVCRRGAAGEVCANVSAAPSPTGESVPLWLAVGVPPLSQGPFNAQNFSEPLIISEPEISF